MNSRFRPNCLNMLLLCLTLLFSITFVGADKFLFNGNVLYLNGKSYDGVTPVSISLGGTVDFENSDGDAHVVVGETTDPTESVIDLTIPTKETKSISFPYQKFAAGTSYKFYDKAAKALNHGVIAIQGTATGIAMPAEVNLKECTPVTASNLGTTETIEFKTSSACKFYTTSSCTPTDVTSMPTSETTATFYIYCDTLQTSQTIKVASPTGGLKQSQRFHIVDPAPVLSQIEDAIVYTCQSLTVSSVVVGDALTATLPADGNCNLYAGSMCSGSPLTSLTAGATSIDLSLMCTSYAASLSLTVSSARGTRVSNTFAVELFPVKNLNYQMQTGQALPRGKTLVQTTVPTANHCGLLCDYTYGCAAFEFRNSDGTCVIKADSTEGVTALTGSDLYLNYLPTNKDSTAYLKRSSISYSGATLTADFDASSMPACLDACESNPACVGFVWLKSLTCELKSEMSDSFVAEDGTSSWFKTSVCGYNTHSFLSYYPYPGPNLKLCSQKCDGNAACTGFIYGPDNVCWLDNVDTGVKPFGYRQYSKQNNAVCATN